MTLPAAVPCLYMLQAVLAHPPPKMATSCCSEGKREASPEATGDGSLGWGILGAVTIRFANPPSLA